MPIRFCFLLILLFGFQSIYSQSVSITRDVYANSYAAANEKAREFDRRHDSQLIQFADGRTVEAALTWKWEYASEYRSRLVYEQKDKKGAIKFEMVVLADKTFCKVGDNAWVQTVGTCSVRASWSVTQMSRMMDATASSEFSLESVQVDGQKLKKYKEIGRYGRRTLPSGAEAAPSFYDTAFWVDSKGRIVRQEYKRTGTEPTVVTSTWIDTVTYLSGLNIDAPIKT
jgi:hypothetical protein